MSDTTDGLKEELAKSVGILRTLRDEIRGKVHLASLDAKQQWNAFEPRVHSALERAASDVSKASHTAVHEVTEALKNLGATLS